MTNECFINKANLETTNFTMPNPVASWEHSFGGGQRLEFSDNETISPTKTLPFPDLNFMIQYDRELKTNDEKI